VTASVKVSASASERGHAGKGRAMERWELGSAGVFKLHTLANAFPSYLGLTAKYTNL